MEVLKDRTNTEVLCRKIASTIQVCLDPDRLACRRHMRIRAGKNFQTEIFLQFTNWPWRRPMPYVPAWLKTPQKTTLFWPLTSKITRSGSYSIGVPVLNTSLPQLSRSSGNSHKTSSFLFGKFGSVYHHLSLHSLMMGH